MLHLTILAALPQEYKPLMTFTRGWHLNRGGSYKVFQKSLPDRQLSLFETGMGGCHLGAILRALSRKHCPDALIIIGFAGGLTHRLHLGQVVLGTRFSARNTQLSHYCDISFQVQVAPKLEQLCQRHCIEPAHVITVSAPVPKSRFPNSIISGIPSVIDMETFVAARWAHERQIPLICFRSISDELQHSIDYDLASITDGGKVRIKKLLTSLLQHPQWLPMFYLSWKRARIAADTLANVVATFLQLPQKELQLILSMQRLVAFRETNDRRR